jgi:hypothetical protein
VPSLETNIDAMSLLKTLKMLKKLNMDECESGKKLLSKCNFYKGIEFLDFSRVYL